jgi:Transposase IS200 like
VSLFRFVTQVVDILAIFPRGHSLIVMSTAISSAHTVWIADEEASHLLFNAEVNHLSRRFMAHVTDTSSSSCFDFVLDMLKLLPATGILCASALLFSELAELLRPLPLKRSDAAARHDDGVAGICRDGGEMDFTQVYRGTCLSWCFFSLRLLNTNMQFKSIVPDQCTCATVFWQSKRQDERLPASTHRQHNPPWLATNGLGRPANRIETFSTPGIPHLHLRMGLAQLVGGFDVGKECTEDRLDRLAMQHKASLGCLMHLMLSRPWGRYLSCSLVKFTARIPHLRGLREKFPHLGKLCGKEHLWASSYYVGTEGSVSAETIKRYVQECRGK